MRRMTTGAGGQAGTGRPATPSAYQAAQGHPPQSVLCLALAAVVLSQMVVAGFTMVLVGAALVLTGLALVRLRLLTVSPAAGRRAALGILVAGVAGHLWRLFSDVPDFLLRDPPEGFMGIYRTGVAVAAALAIVALGSRAWAARAALVLLICIHAIFGAWVIRSSQDTRIDVYVWQRDAVAGLGEGDNPYEMGYPAMLPGSYPEGMVERGKVFGYTYPPLTLLLGYAGAAAGDLRYAYLVAVEGAALLLACMARSRLARGAALLFLATPGMFLVIQLAWTEPVVMLFFAAAVLAACRGRRNLSAAMLGLAIAGKQYATLAILFARKLLDGGVGRRRFLRRLTVAALVVALISLPWFIWSPAGFIRGMVLFPLQTPFRMDSLSFPAALVRAGGPELPSWIGYAALLAAWPLARRAPSDPSGFAAAVAFTLCTLFAFSTHAFFNYYLLVFAVLYTALAAPGPATDSASSQDQQVVPSDLSHRGDLRPPAGPRGDL